MGISLETSDTPNQWRIVAGPTRLLQSTFDVRAWVFTLEREGAERRLIVAVSGHVLEVDAAMLPVETREAIATDGRSAAALVAQTDDPTRCILLGRYGRLPPPPGLVRLASL